ncbi:hypothetical protein QE152_g32209 [Popillia japonica]|uniref:Uncharacterized protein n=1 Tax=Popillia japonica TaxID=7064 RepID=A0AAW1J083_POPJA
MVVFDILIWKDVCILILKKQLTLPFSDTCILVKPVNGSGPINQGTVFVARPLPAIHVGIMMSHHEMRM